VTAGLDDAFTGNEQARAREDALSHGLLCKQVGIVDAEVAHQRDAGAQRLEHVAGGLVGADFRSVVHGLERKLVDAVPAQVTVRLDEARQQSLAMRVMDFCALGRLAEVGAGADADDLAALHLDEAVLDDSSPTAVMMRPRTIWSTAEFSNIGLMILV
jgi:hypothetical protein